MNKLKKKKVVKDARYINLSMERSLLGVMYQSQEKYRELVNTGFRHVYFSDDSHRRMFGYLNEFCKKYRKTPTKKSAISFIKSKVRAEEWPFYKQNINKIFKKTLKKDKNNIEHYKDELEKLWKLRESQFRLRDMALAVESGNIDKLSNSFREGLGVLIRDSANIATEGSPLQDYEERKEIIRLKRAHPELFSCIPTGIEAIDKVVDGLYKGEFYIVGGATGIGKSLFLQEVGFHASVKLGFNVVYFTIEMNKWKCQTRFDSRVSGVPYRKFKNGTISPKEEKKWDIRLRNYNKKGGEYYVIAFNRGCTAFDIEHKASDYEASSGRKIDLMIIDYLNDMKPTIAGKNSKDWDVLGETSWDLAMMSKYWRNNEGVPILTANQAKTGTRAKEVFKPEDLSYSPLPAQHATGVFGITQTPEDEVYERLKLHVAKARDGGTGFMTHVYPNYKICRFHSIKRKNEMEEVETANKEFDSDEQ